MTSDLSLYDYPSLCWQRLGIHKEFSVEDVKNAMIGEFLLFDLSIFMKMLGSFILKIIFSLNNIVSCKKVCPIQIHGGIRIWKNLTTYLQKTKYYLKLKKFLLTYICSYYQIWSLFFSSPHFTWNFVDFAGDTCKFSALFTTFNFCTRIFNLGQCFHFTFNHS